MAHMRLKCFTLRNPTISFVGFLCSYYKKEKPPDNNSMLSGAILPYSDFNRDEFLFDQAF